MTAELGFAFAVLLVLLGAVVLHDRCRDRRRETAEARQWQRFTGGGS